MTHYEIVMKSLNHNKENEMYSVSTYYRNSMISNIKQERKYNSEIYRKSHNYNIELKFQYDSWNEAQSLI